MGEKDPTEAWRETKKGVGGYLFINWKRKTHREAGGLLKARGEGEVHLHPALKGKGHSKDGIPSREPKEYSNSPKKKKETLSTLTSTLSLSKDRMGTKELRWYWRVGNKNGKGEEGKGARKGRGSGTINGRMDTLVGARREKKTRHASKRPYQEWEFGVPSGKGNWSCQDGNYT